LERNFEGYGFLAIYWHFAGFVFVGRGSEISNDADVWDIAEFFIIRGFLGLGMRGLQQFSAI
jgi:hypothetical protein